MWGVLVGLLLISAAISEDVVNSTSESPLEVNKTDKVEESVKASRRSASDNVQLAANLLSGVPSNSAPDGASLQAHEIVTPPSTSQYPNYAEVSLPDLSKYLTPVLNVPSSLVSSQNNRYNGLVELPRYDLNIPVKQIPGQSQQFSTSFLAKLNEPLLNYQNQGSGLYRSVLPYSNIPHNVLCPDHSEILSKIWLTLATLLETGSKTPQINQIKYAMMLINHYLEEINAGNPNELLLKLMLLEAELDKERKKNQYFVPWPNMNPGVKDILPKLTPLNEGGFDLSDFENAVRVGPKCKDAVTRLLQWAQASYETIIKSSDCQGNHNDQPINPGTNVLRDVSPNPYAQISNFNSNYLIQHLLNTPYGQYLLRQMNQKPTNTPNFDALSPLLFNPSLVNQPIQPTVPSIISIDRSIGQTSPYIPSGFFLQPPAMKNTPTIESGKSLPTHILPPKNVYPQEKPLNYIPVTRPNAASSIPPTGLNNLGPISGYSNLPLNVPNGMEIQQLNTNVPENVFNSHVVLPPSNIFDAPSKPPTIDQNAMKGFLQNISQSSAFRENIMNYLNTQNTASNSILSHPTTSKLSHIGNYDHGGYQFSPQVNVNPPFNHIEGNINPVLNNLGINHNVHQGLLPTQQFGSFSQFTYETVMNNNADAHAPVGRNPLEDKTYGLNSGAPVGHYNPQGNNMHGLNHNPYQGWKPVHKVSPTIDWYSIANSSKLSADYTPNGEVELTYAVKRSSPSENPPLYFIKYRIPYDIFLQNIRSSLSGRSDKSDLAKDLVQRYNASEVPKDLLNFRKEEVTEMVVNNGDLIKARYIDDSDNETALTAADSINALLQKSINTNGLDSNIEIARNDFTRSRYEIANPYQRDSPSQLFQRTENINPGSNAYGTSYPSTVNSFQGLPIRVLLG